LLNVEWRNARYNDDGVYQALNTGVSYAAAVPIIPVNGGGTYTLAWSGISISTGVYTVYIQYIDSAMALVEYIRSSYSVYGAQSLMFNVPASARYVAIFVYSQGAVWINLVPDNMMLIAGTDLPDIYIPAIVLNPEMYDPDRIVDIINDSNLIGQTIYTNHTRNVFSGVWEAARYTNGGVYAYYNHDNIATHPTTPVQSDTMYSITWGNNAVNAGQFYVVEFADNGDYIGTKSIPYKYHISQFRTDERTAFLGFQFYYSGGNLDNLTPDYIQVEIGFPTEYVKPYSIQNRDVDFYELINIHNDINIPSYYFADNYLIDKISRVKDLMEKYVANGDAFIFITDEHWEINQRHSPSLINYIQNHVNLKCLVSGGDTANTVSADFCEKLHKAFDRDIYHVVGNHDWFVPATSSMIYYHMHMYNNGLRGNGKDHYYYYDNTLQKIRYIVLNAFTAKSGGDDSTIYVSGYTQEQITWFTNLLAASGEYNIIVLTHYVGANDTSAMQGIATIRNAIDVHNASSTGGKVLAVLQGHTHYDGIFSTDAGVPIITTTCDKNKPYISGGVDLEPWLNDRIAGTINEQAFDADIIDISNNCIYAVRVGAPAMNNYKASSETGFVTAMTAEERIVHYDAVHISGDESLSAVITADAWGCSNTNICTVSDGVVHPVATGKTYVYATNADGQLEVWIIIVD
jgi:hypothetical protein